MTILDLRQRAEAVLKKYEKYDAPQKADRGKSDDPFMEEYVEVEEEVNKLLEAANDIQLEHNRSIIAQKNAEIRRAKNVLLTAAVEALQKKIKKGKGVNKSVIAQRETKISELVDKIYAIPDGTSSGTKRPTRYYGSGLGKKGTPVILNVDGTSGVKHFNPLYHQHTDETQMFERAGMGKGTKKDPIILDNTGPSNNHAPGYWDSNEQTQGFEKEWEDAKAKQDKQLDRVGNVVDRLKEIANNMGDELRQQAPVIDDIENQMDKITHGLKTNNAKLKGLVNSMRSSRNFCVDVILICVILAIAAYIYSMFKK